MTRVAALDCGTNSLRLLISDVDGERLADVVREMEIVRLGEGVDETGRFAAAALDRTFRVVEQYADAIRAHGAERVRMVATSATRDAANRDEFLDGVRSRLGVVPEVVSGDEEAALSFVGATFELRGTGRFPAPYAVCDIGGGSTEFVLGDDAGVRAARSVDIGCVRMTERHLRDDPPGAAQVAAATSDIDAAVALAATTVPLGDARTLVGLAGSVTTVAALVLGLPAYDPERIHHARLSAAEVAETAASLLAMGRAERAALGPMHPGRVDVIGAGALVLDRVMRAGGFAEVVVSEHDILDGIARSLLEPRW
ncbi:MAG: exopolyphosphatase / guanosine-5-triphosphate,3-diphosphate pyrophosphatase [Frankiaceae bacterium]|jgi:exopolyphosphatase/guanosine-5'-triphosphate,3'-diphosphate pyrophosphatase|nr:exopolyphosphatase / guanosine-5-triphosphate,3-diphosphate pyrophosphatase [Frankiaceae bacterium]